MVEQLRSMAYNPINTIDADGSTTGNRWSSGSRRSSSRVVSAAGLPSFYGINIMEINQMGINQTFNKLFAAIVTAEGATVVGGGNTGTFGQSADEIVIGIDRSKDALIRPVVVGEGSPSELQVLVDDQFSVREQDWLLR